MKYTFLFFFFLFSVGLVARHNPVQFSGLEMQELFENSDQLNRYYQKALVNSGDHQRIMQVMERAQKGDSITIGVIGGSITAEANASNESKRWANIIAEWWAKKFPAAKIKLVNAGIGATNSIYGVHRVDRDLLRYNPDFVVIEFSVNDGGTQYVDESYEGLIRKLLNSSKSPGLMALSLLTRDGKNAQEVHLPICRHYSIPMLSQRDALKDDFFDPGVDNASFCDEGSTWCAYSTDDVHPGDWGHAVAAALLVKYLEMVYAQFQRNDLPGPFTVNGFEHSGILDNTNCTPKEQRAWDTIWNGWISRSKNNSLSFDVNAGYIIVNYKRTNVPGKGGKCIVKIDNQVASELSADFSGGWGDYIAYEIICKEKVSSPKRISFHFEGPEGSEFFIENILIANY